jgi:hypothetical protein
LKPSAATTTAVIAGTSQQTSKRLIDHYKYQITAATQRKPHSRDTEVAAATTICAAHQIKTAAANGEVQQRYINV